MNVGPMLRISGLTIDYQGESDVTRALEAVDLKIAPGRALGLVGASGSGKSTLGYAVMRYLAPNARVRSGAIEVDGTDMLSADKASLMRLRGGVIGFVYQDPNTALNPTLTLGEQAMEGLQLHRGLEPAAARAATGTYLERVGLPDPSFVMRRYPHEVSGGEKQRVVIAMAISSRPKLVIFDEPTTALDATTAIAIVDLIDELRRDLGIAALFISHDLGTVARVADEVAVIHRGGIVERGSVAEVLGAPKDAYTRLLISSVPNPHEPAVGRSASAAAVETTPVLSVRGLTVGYERHGFLDALLGRPADKVIAVDNVDLAVGPGETLGLVGESGCGKSSLARAVVGLVDFSGSITSPAGSFDKVSALNRDHRRIVQIIFQHPDQSLNPRWRIEQILSRPLRLYCPEIVDMRSKIARLLEMVELPPEFAARYPHQLSGGQKQRVAIARAFAANPKIVICDEITAGLDVTVQAAILKLIGELKRRLGTSLLFISHDLNVIQSFADRIAVMYFAKIVEERVLPGGPILPPMHPYTEALMSAAPVPDPRIEARIVRLFGPLPSPREIPPGCRFVSRCPRRLGPACDEPPPKREMGGDHAVLCHIPVADLAAVPPIWTSRESASNRPTNVSVEKLP